VSNAKLSTKSALPPKRSHHGANRSGLPPPPTFDLDQLAPSTLLSEIETAAILRNSPHTLAAWRLRDDRRRDHRLAWLTLPNKQIRYRVADIRAYLALGAPPRKKPKSQTPPPAPSRGRRARLRAKAASAPQEAAE
jgi:hypothetical protein